MTIALNTVSASLEQQMGLVFAQADPALRPKVQAPKRKNTEMQGVLAALVDLLPKQKIQRRFQGAEAKPQYGKCGRNCLDRGVCPANKSLYESSLFEIERFLVPTCIREDN